MDISRKLKQLIKVLLVVFMSLTMIVPDGLVKADDLLSVDKDVYLIGEPIMVTASTVASGDRWVALLKLDDNVDAQSYAWYYSDGTTENLLSHMNGRDGITSGSDLPAGNYRVDIVRDPGYGQQYQMVARIPIVITDNENYIATDKTAYDIGEPIMVTARTDTPGAWVALIKDEEDVGDKSFAWFYPNGKTQNLVSDENMNNRDDIDTARELPAGKYKVGIIREVSGTNQLLSSYISITIGVTIPVKLRLDYSNAFSTTTDTSGRTFKYGQELPLEFSSPTVDSNAWIGLYDYSATIPGTASLTYFYLKDQESPMNYFADTGNDLLVPGRYKFVMFKDGDYSIDTNTETGNLCIQSFYIAETYDDENVIWTLSDDKTAATITFRRIDDRTQTKVFDAVVGDKTVKTAATCTEPGVDEYSVSFRFEEENRLVTVNDTVSFTGTVESEAAALGHAWGEWEVVTPATEEQPGLERRVCENDPTHIEEREIPVLTHEHDLTHTEAKAATCTERGNVEYYKCSGCGKYFGDAEATQELDAGSIILPALGHNTGEWICENHKHHKVCERCGEIVDEADCDYETVIRDNTVTKTCKVCGNTYSVTLITTDKEVYEYEDPINIKIDGYDCETGYVWVGLYSKGTTPSGENTSIYWYDNDGYDLTKSVNIKATDNSSGKVIDYETGGEYDIVLMYQSTDGNYYNVVGRKTVTVKPSTVEDSITVDKENDGLGYHLYKYSEEVLVTAISPNPRASVRLCDSDPGATYGYDKGYYVSYNLSDYNEPVDILALAIEKGVKPEPGKQYRIYLISPESSNTNRWVKQAKCELLVTYYDDTDHIIWQLSDDKTTATLTLPRVDDESKTAVFDAVVGTPSTKIAATCTEKGMDSYPVSFEFTEGNTLVTANDITKFSGNVDVETAALGHDWGKWHIDPNDPTKEICECKRCDAVDTRDYVPCDHAFPLNHVEDKDATCTENGNTEYWQCSICERTFADAEAKEEINIDSTILPALGHSYGDLIFDEKNHKHYKECSRCHDRIEEADCDFTWTIEDGKVVYTCKVCHGSYEENLISVDKDTYKQWEPINVTVNIKLVEKLWGGKEKVKDAWVGLYSHGQAPGPNMSIRWYYIYEETNPYDILSKSEGHGIENGMVQGDYHEGDFDLVLLTDGGYDSSVATITVHVTDETMNAGPISLELNDVKQTDDMVTTIEAGDSIVTKTTVDGLVAKAWVGFYDKKVDRNTVFGEDGETSKEWYYISDEPEAGYDFKNRVSAKGIYTIVVFGTGGYDDIRLVTYVDIIKTVVSENTIVEPTCTKSGSKEVFYKDGTSEILPIEALGHDWGEWHFNEEEHTHSRECARCKETATENCSFTSEEKDGIITYTCEVCGGQYTYEKTVADEPVYRASGLNRYFTAIQAADVFMQKTGKEKLDTVVLACGTNFADALAGSYLAAVKDAPILLIDDNEKAVTVENYIKEHMVEGGLVYILGGDKAVAPKFENDLKKAGLTIKRLKGDNRYGTNLEILKEAGIEGDTILVSVGSNYADSLSASATGLPVLLVKDALTKEQKDFLSNYSGKKIYILGGTSAVNRTVEGEMGEYGTVKRIQGANRYETSTKIAEQFFKDADTILLAVGDNFPDGLCGGALAYQLHAPVILVKDGRADYAKKFVKNNGIEKAVVLGGENALKKALVNEILGRDPKADIPAYQ